MAYLQAIQRSLSEAEIERGLRKFYREYKQGKHLKAFEKALEETKQAGND